MLKVATYNIRKGIGTDRRRSAERVLAVLREIDADIVTLQEADRRFGARARVLPDALLDRHSDWRAAPLGMKAASMGWHGNAILLRKSMRLIGCEPIHLPALEPRGAVAADIDTGGDGLVRVVGMHLDLSGLWRRRQAQTIVHHLATRHHPAPAVLMGDLNEWSTTLGCLRDFARHFRVADTGPSFHATRPVARLDRIMLSPDWTIVASGVHASTLARTASDHLPIWAEIEKVGA